MKELNLKPTHKPIRDYYEALKQYDQLGVRHEGAVSNSFAFLLATCAKRGGARLNRNILRFPFAEDFWALAEAGKQNRGILWT